MIYYSFVCLAVLHKNVFFFMAGNGGMACGLIIWEDDVRGHEAAQVHVDTGLQPESSKQGQGEARLGRLICLPAWRSTRGMENRHCGLSALGLVQQEEAEP